MAEREVNNMTTQQIREARIAAVETNKALQKLTKKELLNQVAQSWVKIEELEERFDDMHEFAQMQVELANQVKPLKEENEAIRAKNKSLWMSCVSLTEQLHDKK